MKATFTFFTRGDFAAGQRTIAYPTITVGSFATGQDRPERFVYSRAKVGR